MRICILYLAIKYLARYLPITASYFALGTRILTSRHTLAALASTEIDLAIVHATHMRAHQCAPAYRPAAAALMTV